MKKQRFCKPWFKTYKKKSSMGNEELAVCDVGKIAKRPVKNDKHLPIE